MHQPCDCVMWGLFSEIQQKYLIFIAAAAAAATTSSSSAATIVDDNTNTLRYDCAVKLRLANDKTLSYHGQPLLSRDVTALQHRESLFRAITALPCASKLSVFWPTSLIHFSSDFYLRTSVGFGVLLVGVFLGRRLLFRKF